MSSPLTIRRHWTAAERAAALSLRAEGLSDDRIGVRLGRSTAAVQGQIGWGVVQPWPASGQDLVTAFLAIRTPRGVAGRLTWREAR